MQDMKRRDFLGAGLGAMMGSPLLLAQRGSPPDADMNNDEKKNQPAVKAIQRHRFGVNYTPTKNWFFFWNDFDADAVARDLDAIVSLGMDNGWANDELHVAYQCAGQQIMPKGKNETTSSVRSLLLVISSTTGLSSAKCSRRREHGPGETGRRQ